MPFYRHMLVPDCCTLPINDACMRRAVQTFLVCCSLKCEGASQPAVFHCAPWWVTAMTHPGSLLNSASKDCKRKKCQNMGLAATAVLNRRLYFCVEGSQPITNLKSHLDHCNYIHSSLSCKSFSFSSFILLTLGTSSLASLHWLSLSHKLVLEQMVSHKAAKRLKETVTFTTKVLLYKLVTLGMFVSEDLMFCIPASLPNRGWLAKWFTKS